MAETILSLLFSLSFSGGLMILLVFFVCLLFQKKLSRQWQYYIWVIVLARLLLPFAPEQNLMRGLGERLYSMEQASSADSAKKTEMFTAEKEETEVLENVEKESEDAGEIQNHVWKDILENRKYLCLFWLVAAMLLFLRKLTIYQSFVRFVKAGSTPVDDVACLEALSKEEAGLGIRKAVDLWVNPIVSSPMLIGFFHPRIVLPDAGLPEKEFRYTILHELVHYKRRDMYYKWMVQAVLCIHWFNPLLYFAARSINRLCEFSCDEMVVHCLQSDGQCREYAGTLLNAMLSKGALKERHASLTLSEDKKLLKERMEAIMEGSRRNNTAGKKILAVVLTAAIILTSFFAGSYTADASKRASDITISKLGNEKQEKAGAAGTGRRKRDKITASQADKMALALTNKTWVWEWVKFFVPHMTEKGVKKLIPASRNSEWAGAVDMTTGKKIKFTQKKVNAAKKQKPSDALTCGDIDSHALMIMQSNGDWECISFMLPYMSHKGIRAVVSCYNSKHGGKEKRAKDYF